MNYLDFYIAYVFQILLVGSFLLCVVVVGNYFTKKQNQETVKLIRESRSTVNWWLSSPSQRYGGKQP